MSGAREPPSHKFAKWLTCLKVSWEKKTFLIILTQHIVFRKYHSLYAPSWGVAETNGSSSEEHRQHRAGEQVRVFDQVIEARHRLRRFSLSLKGMFRVPLNNEWHKTIKIYDTSTNQSILKFLQDLQHRLLYGGIAQYRCITLSSQTADSSS